MEIKPLQIVTVWKMRTTYGRMRLGGAMICSEDNSERSDNHPGMKSRDDYPQKKESPRGEDPYHKGFAPVHCSSAHHTIIAIATYIQQSII